MTDNNRDDQIRCECGKMYLIKTKEGYEFKCKRCKRICLLKYEQLIVDYLTKEEGFIDINKV
jgi:phage FluMu protein Com